MDSDLVLSDAEIPPGCKRMFAELRGMPEPYVRSAPYAWGLVKQGLYNLRNVGPWFTLRTFKKYVTRKSSREGGK